MARAKTRPPSTSRRSGPADPVTAYARSVLAGKTVANRLVRLACERHLRDLKRKDLVWDLAAALRVVEFFRDVLKLSGGRFDGNPFELLPWAKFCVGSLFGWKTLDGFRRFHVAYWETAKGSSKSPVGAGIGLYMTGPEGVPGAQNFIAAAKKDQARVPFRQAVLMVKSSPWLRGRFHLSGGADQEWNIAHLPSHSFLRLLASDDSGQSGPVVHFALLDEVHEHADSTMVEMLRKGQKLDPEPLTLMTTNAGSDRQSVCWQEHESARQVLEGGLTNDRLFAYIATLDEGDVPQEADPITYLMEHEELWPKANPGLPLLPGAAYLRKELTNAQGKPGSTNQTLRLNFSQWTESVTIWLAADKWAACNFGRVDRDALRGRPCYGGMDLSSTTDLTAFGLLFPPVAPGDKIQVLMWYWMPERAIGKRDDPAVRESYVAWCRDGVIRKVPGDTQDYDLIRADILEAADTYGICEIGYDQKFAAESATKLAEAGIEMVPIIQTAAGLASATQAFEQAVYARALNHGGHPLLTYNVACAVKWEDPETGYSRLSKRRSSGRIDGAAALVNAFDRLSRHKDATSVYEERVARGEPALLSF